MIRGGSAIAGAASPSRMHSKSSPPIIRMTFFIVSSSVFRDFPFRFIMLDGKKDK